MADFHRPSHYVLDDAGHPAPEDDLLNWGRWMANHERHVALSELLGVTVSTVFLGLDHHYGEAGPPILFETMIFGGVRDQEDQWRYVTREAALAGHRRVVNLALVALEREPE